MMRTVLLVEDDKSVRDALAQTLELAELTPISTGSFIVAKDLITPDFEGVILSDLRMPGRDGFHVLTYAQEVDADLPVILLTGQGDIPMAVKATQQGAFDFLEKPCPPKDLVRVLERALRTRALVMENRTLKAQVARGDPFAEMISQSASEDGQDGAPILGLADQMARAEKVLLANALRKCEGRASVAAAALKLPRKTFYDKLARHGLRAEDFRSPS